ncbi:uncharacterized protein ALTATR162_LOCUS592 [Alternaria atra]|uniref:Uncharacterized protein n=1 Tax=Alternaria atra TaxID=119953 RepID=A0A8J2HTT8_9PLEO|nr:uncharacterized protein ALTATR162_LOCUS592 [Alternaria atra]CAG5139901.1 unnamed protein product [Alternaria atra]
MTSARTLGLALDEHVSAYLQDLDTTSTPSTRPGSHVFAWGHGVAWNGGDIAAECFAAFTNMNECIRLAQPRPFGAFTPTS